MTFVQHHVEGQIHTITLDDPARRNAMSLELFDALDDVISAVQATEDARVIVVRGNGKAFCAGFDLARAVEQPDVMATFIRRLSGVIRDLRRMPGVVIMAVHGAAIAGGCALITAGDFVFVTRSCTLGYPVHPIGVSPAVTIPSLSMKLGEGGARAMLLGGKLIKGDDAHAIGLATHVVDDDQLDRAVAEQISRTLQKGAHALKVTKAWLNELDGSLDDARFDGPSEGSCDLTTEPEAVEMLARFWQARTAR
ncbi:MAG: enoyl-CoA hydratase/isomerase family protein [Planctomycetota bacterium]